jgi:hypothetical protein
MKIRFYTALYTKVIIALFFLSLPSFVSAQSCDYTEGDIPFTAAAGNTDAGYANEYLLTDAAGIILQRITTTTFIAVTQGSYNIYNVNYETATSGGEGTSVTGITVGDDIANVGGICYELSPALPIVVCKILLEWTDVADSGLESVTDYQPLLTISGGDLTNVTTPITVEVAVTGTATGGTDFNPSTTPVTLTIPVGDYTNPTNLNFNDLTADDMSIIEDLIIEDDETVILSMQNPTGLTIGDVDGTDGVENVHTYTIIDNDGLSIEFTVDAGTDSESSGLNLPQLTISGAIITTPITIEVALTGGTATENDDFETVGTDFSVLVTIPVGDYTTAQTLDLNDLTTQDLSIVNDVNVEPTETFVLQLQNPGTGLSIADVDSTDGIESEFTYTITDDDCAAAARTLSKN